MNAGLGGTRLRTTPAIRTPFERKSRKTPAATAAAVCALPPAGSSTKQHPAQSHQIAARSALAPVPDMPGDGDNNKQTQTVPTLRISLLPARESASARPAPNQSLDRVPAARIAQLSRLTELAPTWAAAWKAGSM